MIANIDREETPGPFNFTVIATDLDSDVDQRTENTTSVTLYGKVFTSTQACLGTIWLQ